LDFKDCHKDSVCDPNIVWDAFKCTISGYCIGYSARKKKERNTNKEKLTQEIDDIQTKLADASDDNIYSELVSRLQQTELELNKILDFETNGLLIYIYIRSRCHWAEEGEKSSKYFCNLEKRVCEKKNINRIQSEDQSMVTDTNVILQTIHEFYTNLYSKDDSCDVGNLDISDEFLSSLTIPQLPKEDKCTLEQPISKSEVFRTISSMNLNKSPGYDGLPLECYIVFWADISDMLMESFNFSFKNGLLSPSQRYGVITLLPKKDLDPFQIKNYRPISLLSVDYKIIAKTLANRLKQVYRASFMKIKRFFLKGREYWQ
jgi:hypothetical protein